MNTTKPFKLKPGHMLGLRTNAPNMISHSGFLWPDVGGVATAPDWDPAPQCGRGLHFLPWGAGSASLLHAPGDPETRWLVISTPTVSVVALGGKSKCQTCAVVYCGPKEGALALLQTHAPAGTPIVYTTVTGGDDATVTGGDDATVTGGDGATVTGGDRATVTGGYDATVTGGYDATVTGGDDATVTGGDDATVTGGNRATVTGGDEATVTGGDRATVTGGDRATVTGGDRATVTGGYEATVTGGDRATVTGGDRATVTGGDDATVTGGNRATVTGGDRAVISILYYDGKQGKFRRLLGYVGARNLKPGVAYRVNGEGQFEAVTK